MQNEKRLIDGNALISTIVNTVTDSICNAYEVGTHSFNETLNRLAERQLEIVDMINNAPTVDAVEVVRCKDCKYCKNLTNGIACFCSHNHALVNLWGFCSYGERKEQNDE